MQMIAFVFLNLSPMQDEVKINQRKILLRKHHQCTWLENVSRNVCKKKGGLHEGKEEETDE